MCVERHCSIDCSCNASIAGELSCSTQKQGIVIILGAILGKETLPKDALAHAVERHEACGLIQEELAAIFNQGRTTSMSLHFPSPKGMRESASTVLRRGPKSDRQSTTTEALLKQDPWRNNCVCGDLASTAKRQALIMSEACGGVQEIMATPKARIEWPTLNGQRDHGQPKHCMYKAASWKMLRLQNMRCRRAILRHKKKTEVDTTLKHL